MIMALLALKLLCKGLNRFRSAHEKEENSMFRVTLPLKTRYRSERAREIFLPCL